MSSHSHPYTNLPKHSFWKTAVTELDSRQIDLAWTPKFPITRATKIITAGSCFAQHISRSLRENGFSWLESELAPTLLATAEHARHGYGVFSFRTGNIYTSSLLKQWIMWTSGKAVHSLECTQQEGRSYDPFRPSLPAEGFSSPEEMLAARRTSLAAMLEVIKQADLFIFTLGLTEAWLNRDGSVYPICPGTIRGTFSPEDHVFHNYDDPEVVRDLTDTFDELRSINPNLRFLLTVSPVPLTATASGQHVLTATTYSKSVLRSAAGYLAQSRADTDYFPSFELITAPVFKGKFFEQNMRSVSSDGVAFVMGQFFGAIGAGVASADQEISAGTSAVAANGTVKTESGNEICDDIILETWRTKPFDDSQETPNILLIGDSQMGMIAKALDEQDIRYSGGAIMNGSDWHALQFVFQQQEPFFIPTIREAKAMWDAACAETIFRIPKHERKDLWILTNIGFHTNQLFSMNGIFGYLQKIYGSKMGPGASLVVSMEDLRSYIHFARPHHIQLLQNLVTAGFRVIWIGDPPADARNLPYLVRVEQILAEQIRTIGCEVYSASDWVINQLGSFPKAFVSTEIDPSTGQLDVVHGSPEYYRQLIKQILDDFKIQPKYRQSG